MKQRKPYNKVEERAKETVILSSFIFIYFLVAFVAMGIAYGKGAWF
nr:MAG TPA: hypothetical protein [Caudoviricetes sp.]